MEEPNSEVSDWCSFYESHGIRLVPLDAGTKKPRFKAWNQPGKGYHSSSYASSNAVFNAGIHLVDSRMVCIDVDDEKRFIQLLAEAASPIGMTYAELCAAGTVYRSGKPNRAKILFKIPVGYKPSDFLSFRVFHAKSKTSPCAEFHCIAHNGNSLQDVLPPTVYSKPNEEGQLTRYTFEDEAIAFHDCPHALASAWKANTDSKRAQAKLQPSTDGVYGWLQAYDDYMLESRTLEQILLDTGHYTPIGFKLKHTDQESGNPGVVILPDGRKGWSFSESDPLFNGRNSKAQSFGPSDIALHYDYKDDKKAFQKYALSIQSVQAILKEQDAELLADGKQIAINLIETDKNKQRIPCLLQQGTVWLSNPQQREFPIENLNLLKTTLEQQMPMQSDCILRSAILAAMSAVATDGEKLSSYTGFPSSTYFLLNSKSGNGKEIISDAAVLIVKASMDPALLGAEKAFTEQGVVSQLRDKQTKLFVMDEFGKFLKRALHGKSVSESVITFFVSAFSKYKNQLWQPLAYSTIGQTEEGIRAREVVLVNTRPVMVAVSQPEILFQAVDSENFTDGFFGRFIHMIDDESGGPREPIDSDVPLSEEWSAWINGIRLSRDAIQWPDSLREKHKQLRNTCWEFCRETHSDEAMYVYKRVAEHVARLCNLLARCAHTEVTEEIYKYAFEYVAFGADSFLHSYRYWQEKQYECDVIKTVDKLEEIIRQLGSDATKTAVHKKMRQMERFSHSQMEQFKQILELRNIHLDSQETGGKGRPRMVYMFGEDQ